MLKVSNLHVKTEDKKILNGVDLEIGENEIHVLMGPNGSGKTTLAHILMGHPGYKVTKGRVEFEGKDISELPVNDRAGMGMFLSFQYPSEVSGVSISNFLRMIYNKRFDKSISPAKFRKILMEKMKALDIDESFVNRYLNEGFSGGEKKKMEILQMLVLEPKLAILDETDSGLDIDALKLVSKNIVSLKEKTKMSVLIITHYTRILEYIDSDEVHVMKNGEIVESGGNFLARNLEKKGYAPFGA